MTLRSPWGQAGMPAPLEHDPRRDLQDSVVQCLPRRGPKSGDGACEGVWRGEAVQGGPEVADQEWSLVEGVESIQGYLEFQPLMNGYSLGYPKIPVGDRRPIVRVAPVSWNAISGAVRVIVGVTAHAVRVGLAGLGRDDATELPVAYQVAPDRIRHVVEIIQIPKKVRDHAVALVIHAGPSVGVGRQAVLRVLRLVNGIEGNH